MAMETELEQCEKLFAFLQGRMPDGVRVDEIRIPRLTPAQAWTVIWYLGELHWQVPDHIERCDICGDLFDSEGDGSCLDGGGYPYHFCGSCESGDEYYEKLRKHPELDPERMTLREAIDHEDWMGDGSGLAPE